jgi:hypothetical protein
MQHEDGAAASMLSIGLLARLLVPLSRPSTPSWPSRAPMPPIIGSSTTTLRSPCAVSSSASTTGVETPPLAAAIKVRSPCNKAAVIMSKIRRPVGWRTPTAAGGSAFTTLPAGAKAVTAR